MCKSNGKLEHHLSLNCEVARDSWSLILCLFGVCWVVPRTVLEVFACWTGLFETNKKKRFGDLEVHSVVLNVMPLERNECMNFCRTGIFIAQPKFLFSVVLIYVGTCCQICWLIRFFFFFGDLLCIHPVYKGSAPFCAFLIEIF